MGRAGIALGRRRYDPIIRGEARGEEIEEAPD
jgi:hypothetical protein